MIKNKIETYDQMLTEKVFKIYGRSDLTTACLLTFCSALRFNFNGQVLPRGWMDILLLGDTRCGKSTVAKQLVSNLRMGDFFSCENTSFAGLIGGLQQMSAKSKWDIVWGKIPLNTGKCVVADEMSSIRIEDIGNMSAVRSSGIAEISKVQSGMTKCQTRIIWISNPRSEQSMDCYPYGILAVKELIGRPEDIARFDVVIGIRTDDVPPDTLNTYREHSTTDFDFEPLRHLVRWAWSLKVNDILFPEETVKKVLESASAQSKLYCPQIPLVEPNEQRVKLARVAVAVAVRSYSEVGGRLMVLPEHVEFADYFMRKCFNSKGLAYDEWSKSIQADTVENTECAGKIRELFSRFGTEGKKSIKILNQFPVVSVSDIETIFDLPKAEARNILSMLVRYGCLVKKSAGYTKTSFGVKVMDELGKGGA